MEARGNPAAAHRQYDTDQSPEPPTLTRFKDVTKHFDESRCKTDKNSSGDEIANVNLLRQHRTRRGQRLRPLNDFLICTKHLRYLPTHQTEF